MKWIIDQIQTKNNHIAIICNDRENSYTDLYRKIRDYYEEVSEIIPVGKIVAVLSDYSFDSIALFFALYQNNNIIVPITSKVDSEIKERIKTASCDFAIGITQNKLKISTTENSVEHHQLVTNLRNINQSGLILFSSGSTGTPKAMIHNLDNLINSYKDKSGKNLVFLIFLMFDHIGGLNTLLNCLSMGVTMVFPSNRDPEYVCELIDKHKINILPASPTFLNLILMSEASSRNNLSSLRMITYGTEPMPSSLLGRLRETFPNVKFIQTFGTSETGISQMSSKSSTSTFMKFEDLNTETKIIDGELYIKSKTQILGYLNSSMERFTEDGWFRTGDIVEESEDGFIKIVGRNSEIINVGGEKVLPSEIESVLYQFSKIRDCIVYGEPNPITGQIVVAKVLFSEKVKASEVKREITVFCIDKLERYKIPAKIILMSESEFSDRYKKKRI
jgi:acyl-CoA synthetase (AMP-forming)/AMP-acid ligase II